MFRFMLQWVYSDRRGADKNHHEKNFPYKIPWTKPSVKNLRELTQTPCKAVKTNVRMHVLLKIGGSKMYDVL